VVLKALYAGKKWPATITNMARSSIGKRDKFAHPPAFEIARLAISQWAITDALKSVRENNINICFLSV